MTAYIARRLLQMIPLLIIVTMITFAATSLTGSPINRLEFDPRVKPEDIQRLRHSLGLDKPLYERYLIWVGNLLRGDFGYSVINFRPVRDRILDVMPNTLILAVLSTAVSLSIAIPVGVNAAIRRNSIFDRISSLLAVAGFAVPTVWLGLMLILLFSYKFREWGFPSLPVGGVRDVRGSGGLADRVEHLILPVVALSLPQMAGWIVFIRSSMLEVIRQDFIRTAEAKGLFERTVRYSHAFRNAMVPLVTLIGLSLPGLFSGALVVENVFAYPGMGRLIVTAVGDKDYTVVMGTTVMYTVLVVFGNLLADILYVAVDPRIRYD
jgi:peptide/nickel transport system permease protein